MSIQMVWIKEWTAEKQERIEGIIHSDCEVQSSPDNAFLLIACPDEHYQEECIHALLEDGFEGEDLIFDADWFDG